MHRTMIDFVNHLVLAGREETARSYRSNLNFFDRWLAVRKLDPITASGDDLLAYQRHLAEDYRTTAGRKLGRGTQACRLACIKAFYSWMERRGMIAVDVSEPIQLPRIPPRMVKAQHLTLQEATALLQTKAKRVNEFPEGCYRWADQVRELAFLCVALASGRRRAGLRHLKLAHADLDRNELRVEREKGKTGRVLPIAGWAMAILRIYIERARPVLNWHRDNHWLFVGDRTPRLGRNTVAEILRRAHAEAVAANPDLEDLATKHLSPHSLRVTFASLMFLTGGASLRTINELMLHEQLSTTARYTPVPLEDLRRVCLAAHPRA